MHVLYISKGFPAKLTLCLLGHVLVTFHSCLTIFHWGLGVHCISYGLGMWNLNHLSKTYFLLGNLSKQTNHASPYLYLAGLFSLSLTLEILQWNACFVHSKQHFANISLKVFDSILQRKKCVFWQKISGEGDYRGWGARPHPYWMLRIQYRGRPCLPL